MDARRPEFFPTHSYTPKRRSFLVIAYPPPLPMPCHKVASSALELFQLVDLELADAEDRVCVLALDHLLPPDALLLLDDDLHGLRLRGQHHGAALEQALVDVRSALERQIAAAQHASAVEPQDVPGHDTLHAEGQAQHVARGHQVRPRVHVDGDVVPWLGGEEGEKRSYRGIELGGR